MTTLYEHMGGDEALHRLYMEAADEADLPADEPFRSALREHVELGAQVAQQNSRARSEDELYPLDHVPRWSWDGDDA